MTEYNFHWCFISVLCYFVDFFKACGMKEDISLVRILQRIKEKYKYPDYIFPDGAVRRDLHICVSILNELKSCVSFPAKTKHQSELWTWQIKGQSKRSSEWAHSWLEILIHNLWKALGFDKTTRIPFSRRPTPHLSMESQTLTIWPWYDLDLIYDLDIRQVKLS